MKKYLRNQKGFTLIELLITMLLAGIVLGAVFMVYANQQRTFVSSDRVAVTQQNLRAALILMASEIREAGCDPKETSGAGVVSASIARFHFTRDIKGSPVGSGEAADGDVTDGDEDIEFGFSAGNDADDNGIADAGRG